MTAPTDTNRQHLYLEALKADATFSLALRDEYGPAGAEARYRSVHASAAVQKALRAKIEADDRWLEYLKNS